MWWWLVGAIVFEVIATCSLRSASVGRSVLYPVVVLGYAAAYACLSRALSHGMGLGVAYGVWAAVGVALVAVVSVVAFGEPLSQRSALGLVLIGVGVLVVEIGVAPP